MVSPPGEFPERKRDVLKPYGFKGNDGPFLADFSEGLETGLYLALLELIDEGLIITGDEVILETNSAACRLLEREYGELVGMQLSSLFPSEKGFLEARERLFIQGEMRGSLLLVLPGGRRKNMRFIAAARIHPGVHAIIISPDLIAEAYADSDKTETVVRDVSDTVWPRLAAVVDQPVLVLSAAGKIAAINSAAVKLFRKERAGLLGVPLEQVMQVRWPQEGEVQVAVLQLQNAPSMQAKILPGAQAGWRILVLNTEDEAHGQALPAIQAVPTVQAPAAENPEKRQVRADCTGALEQLFEHHPRPVLCIESKGRIIAVNKATVLQYGFSREAALDMTVFDLCHDTATAEMVNDGVYCLKKNDGQLIDVQMTVYPLHDVRYGDVRVLMQRHSSNALFARGVSLDEAVCPGVGQALQQNQLTVFFQTVADFRNGCVAGVEALMRWQHPRLGRLPYRYFASLAKHAGVLIAFETWLLQQVCVMAAQWQQFMPGIQQRGVTVNVTPELLMDDRFPRILGEIFEKTGLMPTLLELDVAEYLLPVASPLFMRRLKWLDSLGVRLAVDHFGGTTGALRVLSDYPLKAVKLNAELIRTDEYENEGFPDAVASAAKTCGLALIAQGVVSAEQQNCLYASGYYLQQGPLYGLPFSAAECTNLLSRNIRRIPEAE